MPRKLEPIEWKENIEKIDNAYQRCMIEALRRIAEEIYELVERR